MPTVVISNGELVTLGSPSSDMMKYAQRHSAAPSPHSTPTGCSRNPLNRSRTNTMPAIATPAPTRIGAVGGVLVRHQCQPMSSTGARYSSSSATPTERYCIALK